jgi:TolB-like protein/class 3 adenylate cyclase/Flp pilus assembly protein TadD
MAEERVQRRLAAILATDMVGYSRLMEADERGTIARQKAHRNELIDYEIAAHNGRIVKTTGDGLLVEFASVVDATECAVAIQRGIAGREADAPEERRIQYRMGVNLGDIVIDGDDILGDGVNVAARLEGLAEPGGICIPRKVFHEVRNKLDVGYEFAGEQKVKNIETPIPVYRVLLEPDAAGTIIGEKRPNRPQWQLGAVAAAAVAVIAVAVSVLWWQPWVERVEPASAESMAFSLPKKPSIAVLPFDNMSGDPGQEYFVDGLTDAIIGRLSQSPFLFVIARNSTFIYKGKAVEVRQVSEELGVRYVLEGSFQRTGDQIRVNAQLIDAVTGYHAWSQQYDREATDIFAVQDDIALTIAATLDPSNEGQIALAERTRVRSKGTENLQAYDHVLRSQNYWFQYEKEANLLGREEDLKAIALDPNYARPYAYAGWSYLAEAWFGWSSTPEESLAKAFEWARKAIAVDDKEYFGHWLLAEAYMANRQFAEAGAAYERALALSPNDALVLMNYGEGYLVPVGRAEEGLETMKRAMRLNPRHPDRWHGNLAYALYMLGRYEEAIASIIKVSKSRVDHRTLLAGSYAYLGQMDRARAVVEEILRTWPDYNLKAFARSRQFKKPEDAARWVDGPRKAGLPE